MNTSIATTIAMWVLVIIYTYFSMEFVDNILNEPKITKANRLIVGCINGGLLWVILAVKTAQVPVAYIMIFLVFALEFLLFYRESLKRVYFMAAAVMFHIMAIHSIIVSVSAWIKGIKSIEIITSPTYVADTLSILMLILIIAVVIIIKVIPTDKVQVLCQQKEQLFFMNLSLTVFNFYFIMNARIYTQQLYDQVFLENQIIMSLSILMGLYILLYFAFNMSTLLGYKIENKKLLQDYYREQQYHEAFISEAITVYESNFTQELLVNGFDSYEQQYGNKIHDYRFMLSEIAQQLVYEEDITTVYEYSDPTNILKAFEEGSFEITIDYRRLKSDDSYGWVRSVTHIYQDRITGDVMGFTYAKDIDQEKQHQLALQERAERDSLTGLYNKGTAEMMITSYLEIDVECKNTGALFLIDVDNFKNINDHLGHAKGDEVLCELTSKLKKIFRSDDIVGRAGGDEFLVYIKRSSNQEIVEEKAKEVCLEFERKYTSSFGVTYAVSASIGIAIYPAHGLEFTELYKMADIALYNSKNKGKNAYTIYEGESFAGYESSRTKIDQTNELSKKHFIDNRLGYVFETLYRAESLENGINDILELLTKHYNYSRGYIFETSADRETTSNTFEWCNNGISPEINNLQEVPIEAVETSTRAFLRDGKFVMKSLDSLPELDRSVLEPQGIKSMLQFAIIESKQLIGFIGFDDCTAERHPSDQEIEELGTVCNIVTTFLIKHRLQQRLEKNILKI